MSLVGSYVQSQSGKWYEHPSVRGPGWFICWDDDDPIELVIRRFGPNGEDGPNVNDILKSLREQGWHLHVTSKGLSGDRLFKPVDWNSEEFQFGPARSYFLRQVSGAPTDKMLKDNGSDEIDIDSVFQGVLYSRVPDAQGESR